MTTVALMPIAEEADAAVAYAEGTVSWNIKMMLMTPGKSQTALADALGVQRAAISKKIRGSVSWSLADLVRAADFLDTDISTLLDDSLMKQLQGMGNRKATGDTPMASGELLRLGLNQRPSDTRFCLSAFAVGLFATGVDTTPASLFLQIGVSPRMFTLQLVFRRASASNAQ